MGIETRPAVVDARSRLGEREGDTIVGKGRQGVLLTMVERRSLYVRIVRLKGRQADGLAAALTQDLAGLKDKVKPLTFDNGREFSRHEEIGKNPGGVYFARSYASWQRESNENTNGLIRQYFPKGISNQRSER